MTLGATPIVTVNAATLSVGGPIGGGFGLIKSGVGTLTLSGSNTDTGTTSINAGTLQIGNAGTTGALATTSVITGSAGGTLAFSCTDTVTQGTHFNSVIGGAINLTQAGSGTLVLNQANTYTGTTSIDAGTLALTGSAGSIANSSMIRVGSAGSSAAVLDLTSKTGTVAFTSSQTVGGIGTIQMGAGATAQFAGILAPGNSAGVLTFDGGTALLSGTTQIEIFGGTRGTGYDAVDLINSAAIDYGNSVLALDFGLWLADEQTYQLFGNGSATLLADFSALSIDGTNYSGLTFTGSSGVWTSQGTSPSGQTLTFTTSTGTLVIVPEPATVTLAGLGIAAAAYALRRTLASRSTSGGSRAKQA